MATKNLSDLPSSGRRVRTISPSIVEEFFWAKGPSSSVEVRGLVIHDIKEVEGVRQQEEQEDKRDEEIGDEVNGEVENVRRDAQHTHET